MGFNIEKLENVKYKGSRIVARCPACAEQGNDNKGEHLFIDEQGRFSCVIYPGETGTDHRKRIFVLVGIKDGNNKSYLSQQNKVIKVKTVDRNTGTVIKSNILGHLGRVFQPYARKEEDDIKDSMYKKDFEKSVPSVPTEEPPSVEKPCKCGRRATVYDFGRIENGKFDWTFYCNTCSPYSLPIQ